METYGSLGGGGNIVDIEVGNGDGCEESEDASVCVRGKFDSGRVDVGIAAAAAS